MNAAARSRRRRRSRPDDPFCEGLLLESERVQLGVLEPEVQPEDALAREITQILAMMEQSEGSLDKAIERYRRALELKPDLLVLRPVISQWLVRALLDTPSTYSPILTSPFDSTPSYG